MHLFDANHEFFKVQLSKIFRPRLSVYALLVHQLVHTEGFFLDRGTDYSNHGPGAKYVFVLHFAAIRDEDFGRALSITMTKR